MGLLDKGVGTFHGQSDHEITVFHDTCTPQAYSAIQQMIGHAKALSGPVKYAGGAVAMTCLASMTSHTGVDATTLGDVALLVTGAGILGGGQNKSKDSGGRGTV